MATPSRVVDRAHYAFYDFAHDLIVANLTNDENLVDGFVGHADDANDASDTCPYYLEPSRPIDLHVITSEVALP